jgi:hypothetical protein
MALNVRIILAFTSNATPSEGNLTITLAPTSEEQLPLPIPSGIKDTPVMDSSREKPFAISTGWLISREGGRLMVIRV